MAGRKFHKARLSDLENGTIRNITSAFKRSNVYYDDIDMSTLTLTWHDKLSDYSINIEKAHDNISRYISINGNKFVNKKNLTKILGITRPTLDDWLINKKIVSHIIYPETWKLLYSYYDNATVGEKKKIMESSICKIYKNTAKALSIPQEHLIDDSSCVKYHSANNKGITKREVSLLFGIEEESVEIKPNPKIAFLKPPSFKQKTYRNFVRTSSFCLCFSCSFLDAINNKSFPVSKTINTCRLISNLYYSASCKFKHFELRSVEIQLSERINKDFTR